jgi:hypothetical protein
MGLASVETAIELRERYCLHETQRLSGEEEMHATF